VQQINSISPASSELNLSNIKGLKAPSIVVSDADDRKVIAIVEQID
jgi:hypothetical protein